MKYLIFCIFFSCIAMQDPLAQFGIGASNEVSINYNDINPVYIKDVYIHNSSIYIFFITGEFHGVVRQHDMAGNVLKEVVMMTSGDPFYIIDKIQILWKENYFYVPGWCRSGNRTYGVIQKYNYQVELQESFGNNGTVIFGDINASLLFNSIASVGSKYFAAGYNEIQWGGADDQVDSSYMLVDFNLENGSINHYYQESALINGNTRSVKFMEPYYQNSKYYVVGITFENELIYQELNENNDLLFQKVDGVRIDYMIPVNEARTQFYGVDNLHHYLYLITITLGLENALEVNKVADIGSFGSNSYPWVSSLAIKNKTLLLGGGYDTSILSYNISTPFVLAYNIADPVNPVWDTTYFKDGRWGMQGLFPGNYYKSAIFFLRNNPYSFLLGYGSVLFHVASPKGFYDSLDNIKKSQLVPFVS